MAKKYLLAHQDGGFNFDDEKPAAQEVDMYDTVLTSSNGRDSIGKITGDNMFQSYILRQIALSNTKVDRKHSQKDNAKFISPLFSKK